MDVFASIITGVSITILLCNVVGNILVIMVIKKNKKLHNANTYLLANLAASDLAFAVLTFIDIFLLSNQSAYSFAEFIFHALTSIYMLVALAVERYFAILKPFVHLTRAGKSLMCKVLLAIWILAGVLSAPGYPIAALSEVYAKKNAMFTGPVQQDFDWGGLNVSQLFCQFFFFFWLGGGLVTLRYRKVKSKINK